MSYQCESINIQFNTAECSLKFCAANNVFQFCAANNVSAVYWHGRPPFATSEVAAVDDVDASDCIAVRYVPPRRARCGTRRSQMGGLGAVFLLQTPGAGIFAQWAIQCFRKRWPIHLCGYVPLKRWPLHLCE